MQKIDGTTIKVNRGDILTLNLSLKLNDGTPYTFQQNDKVVFSIYEAGKLSKEALILKEITVQSETQSLIISLTTEETKIGGLVDYPKEYWYEIELNDQYTVIGYDDNGAKLFMLYPEGSKLL